MCYSCLETQSKVLLEAQKKHQLKTQLEKAQLEKAQLKETQLKAQKAQLKAQLEEAQLKAQNKYVLNTSHKKKLCTSNSFAVLQN